MVHQLDEDGTFHYSYEAETPSYNSVMVSLPNKQEGHVLVWTTDLCSKRDIEFGKEGTGFWEQKEDHRTDDLYTEDGEYKINSEWGEFKYNGIGAIPEWLSLTAPEIPETPPYIPQIVTRRQGRLALLEVGKLLQVEVLISSIGDSLQQMAAQIEYEADTWERGNLFLQGMWMQLGGTEEELDNLFILANSK